MNRQGKTVQRRFHRIRERDIRSEVTEEQRVIKRTSERQRQRQLQTTNEQRETERPLNRQRQ